MMRRFWFALLPAIATAAVSAGPDAVPLFFVSNHGQAAPGVRFLAQGSGLIAYFSDRQALFQSEHGRVRLEFVGAEEGVEIVGAGTLPAKANFLIGDESEWRLDVQLHQGIVYRN